MIKNKEDVIQQLVTFCQDRFMDIYRFPELQMGYYFDIEDAKYPKRGIIKMTEAADSDVYMPVLDENGEPLSAEEEKIIREMYPDKKNTVRNWNVTSTGVEVSKSILPPAHRNLRRSYGCYHKVPVYEFRFIDDDQRVLFDANVGPLYGYKVTFNIETDESGNSKLGNGEIRWIS